MENRYHEILNQHRWLCTGISPTDAISFCFCPPKRFTVATQHLCCFYLISKNHPHDFFRSFRPGDKTMNKLLTRTLLIPRLYTSLNLSMQLCACINRVHDKQFASFCMKSPVAILLSLCRALTHTKLGN